MKQINYLAIGNSKTGKQTLSFSVPRLKTCKPSVWCLKNCYASKGHFCFKNLQKLYLRNYEFSLTDAFVPTIIAEIKRRKPKHLRIHVCGDFYSIEYIMKWAAIIKACPEVTFKVFTRRDDFIEKFYEMDIAYNNLSIHYSIDDSASVELLTKVNNFLPLANVYNERFNLRTSVTCGGGCVRCDYACWIKGSDVTLNLRG